MHFFNPVHIMKLVEVVEAPASAEEAVQTALELATRMGKEPIRVTDSPGFASSRLGLAIGLEAMRMLESGVASAGGKWNPPAPPFPLRAGERSSRFSTSANTPSATSHL